MITMNTLQPAEGSRKNIKRVGRGRGSGQGCTAGYGNNGAKARSGANIKLYYEGGQTPITRRLPKRGFNNMFRVEYQIVNVGDLQAIEFEEKEITPKTLVEKGLVGSEKFPVKILGCGDLSKCLIIKANAFSKSAREKIDRAKGKAEVITRA